MKNDKTNPNPSAGGGAAVADTYEIYQIEDTRGVAYCFRDYVSARDRLHAADYRRVYAGPLAPTLTLDAIYLRHNRDDRPLRREMRSLSVSDVIVVTRAGERKAYYVDSFGFAEVPEFFDTV